MYLILPLHFIFGVLFFFWDLDYFFFFLICVFLLFPLALASTCLASSILEYNSLRLRIPYLHGLLSKRLRLPKVVFQP